jgi:hypothetical protein
MPIRRAVIAALHHESDEIKRMVARLEAELEAVSPDARRDAPGPTGTFAGRVIELQRRNAELVRKLDIAETLVIRLGQP